MSVTASAIKELREISGAGMMDCKKALVASEGNIEKAIDWLREKGIAKAAKKAGRIASEGLVDIVVGDEFASIVEVNSETDYVAKNQDFINYVNEVAVQASKTKTDDINDFMQDKWLSDETKTVKDVLTEKVLTIGENLNIRRFKKIDSSNGVVVSYIHGGGKIGVLVKLDTTSDSDKVKDLGRNIAMQIAALNPQYISRDEISSDYIEKETEILKQEALKEGKPEAVVEKMVVGRLNKQLKEVCLVDQSYVKDPDMTILKYVDSIAKEVGCDIKIESFIRFETGEGLAKREENFAEEVAKQVQSVQK